MADTLHIQYLQPDLVCFRDSSSNEASNSFFIRDGSDSILVDAGWSENTQVPSELALSVDNSIKVATHFHSDHVSRWFQMENVFLSPKQAAYCSTSACNPSRWQTIKRVTPFKMSAELSVGTPVLQNSQRTYSVECDGHSQTDLCFIDKKTRTLFIGDLFYEGPVFYFLPGGSLKNARESIERLLARNDWDTIAQTHGSCQTPRSKLAEFSEDLKKIDSGNLGWKWTLNFVLPLIEYKVRSGSVVVRPLFP